MDNQDLDRRVLLLRVEALKILLELTDRRLAQEEHQTEYVDIDNVVDLIPHIMRRGYERT